MIRLTQDGGVVTERDLFLLFSVFDPIKVLLELHEEALHHYCTRLVHIDRGCFNFLNV